MKRGSGFDSKIRITLDLSDRLYAHIEYLRGLGNRPVRTIESPVKNQTPPPAPKPLLTLEDAAEQLSVSKRFLYALARRSPPQLRVVRIGRRVLIPRAELERLSVEGAIW